MPTVYKINQSKIDIHYLMPTVYKINQSKIDIQYLMPTVYKKIYKSCPLYIR